MAKPLQQLISGNYTPQADPTGASLYADPSWWAKIWSPEAQDTAAKNAAFAAAPTQAAQAHSLAVTEAGRNFQNLTPEARQLIGSPESYYAQYGGKPLDQTSTEQELASRAFMDAGGVGSATDAKIAALKAQGQESNNLYSNARVRSLLGAPENQAFNEAANTDYDTRLKTGMLGLLPGKLGLEGIQLGNDTALATGLSGRIPTLNNTADTQAGIENRLAGQQSGLLGTTMDTTRNNAIMQNVASRYGGKTPSQALGGGWYDKIDPSGSVVTDVGNLPTMANMQAKAMQQYAGDDTPHAATNAQGNPLPLPPMHSEYATGMAPAPFVGPVRGTAPFVGRTATASQAQEVVPELQSQVANETATKNKLIANDIQQQIAQHKQAIESLIHPTTATGFTGWGAPSIINTPSSATSRNQSVIQHRKLIADLSNKLKALQQ